MYKIFIICCNNVNIVTLSFLKKYIICNGWAIIRKILPNMSSCAIFFLIGSLFCGITETPNKKSFDKLYKFQRNNGRKNGLSDILETPQHFPHSQ